VSVATLSYPHFVNTLMSHVSEYLLLSLLCEFLLLLHFGWSATEVDSYYLQILLLSSLITYVHE
jgi:hypothetical protein